MTLPPPLPTQKKLDHLSVWQIVLGVIGLSLSLLSIAALLIVINLPKTAKSNLSLNTQQIPFFFWILGASALLSVPSILYASRRIKGFYSAELVIGKKHAIFAIAALVLWTGFLYIGQNAAKWKIPGGFTSPLNILVIALPIFILLTLGLFRLKFGGKQRAWGLINLTIFATIQIILLLEFIVVVIAGIVLFLWLSKQAQFAPFFSGLLSKGGVTQQSLTSLINELTPLLSKPWLYLGILLIFSLLVPMIEELFKPLGVWFLAGKTLSPVQGFTAGLICGAVFGLFESLSMISGSSGSTWLYTAVARIGTGLLHMFTAGMSGWALASSWQDKKYIRITLVYTGVVLLHGCWNLFALLMGLSSLAIPVKSDFLTGLMNFSPWVLFGIAVLMFAALLTMNIWLQKKATPPELPVFSDKLVDSSD